MIFRRYSHDIPMIFRRYSHDIPKIFPWYSHDIPKIFPWYAKDWSINHICWKMFIEAGRRPPNPRSRPWRHPGRVPWCSSNSPNWGPPAKLEMPCDAIHWFSHVFTMQIAHIFLGEMSKESLKMRVLHSRWLDFSTWLRGTKTKTTRTDHEIWSKRIKLGNAERRHENKTSPQFIHQRCFGLPICLLKNMFCHVLPSFFAKAKATNLA